MNWNFVLFGALLSGPVWLLVAYLMTRRLWKAARKLSARTRGKEQLAELGQLAGGLAHEIKNPLSTINVNLQLLSEDIASSENPQSVRIIRRIKSVQSEADRLGGILDDFLHYAGKVELMPSPTNIAQLIEELVDFFSAQASAGRVVVRTALADKEIICNLDADLIKQAVLNLMINAVQAMPDGGELMLKASVCDGRADIEIIDTGTGISAESLGNIFKVYYSTKKGGSGLGLAVARRVINEHGGSIRVESEPAKGTRFVISIPLAD